MVRWRQLSPTLLRGLTRPWLTPWGQQQAIPGKQDLVKSGLIRHFVESTEVVMEKNALPDTNGLNMEDCATESVWTDRDTTRPDPEGHEGGQSDGLEYHTVTPSIGGRSRARLRGDIRKDDLLDTNDLPRCVEGSPLRAG